MPHHKLISEFETIIRRDPARRGLIGSDNNGPGRGELAKAADIFGPDSMITGVGLVTGFFIPDSLKSKIATHHGSPKTYDGHAETDGPPGTVVLADVLANLRIPTTIITDQVCEPVVKAACNAVDNLNTRILASPIDRQHAAAWRTHVLSTMPIMQISHFIAIERVGPGYTDAETGQKSASPFD